MRYLRKGLPKVVPSEGRAKIVSFLESVYNSIAETLPDVRDDWDGDVAEGLPELADAYADALMAHDSETVEGDKEQKRKKGKRARKNSLVINTQRFEGRELRFLPPGCMRDYYEQMNAAGGSDCPPCGFVTFWRVWREEFPFLLFRSTSPHTICSTCTNHKIMIKELHGHLRARQEQHRLFAAHLRAQYQDRLTYWGLRGTSRDSPFEVTLILDGMDQGKFAYPRSELFRAKELATLSRPRAHITGMICHGHFLLFSVSPANLPKDSNMSIELTAHALQLLSRTMDISKLTFNIQSDNTAREVKTTHTSGSSQV